MWLIRFFLDCFGGRAGGWLSIALSGDLQGGTVEINNVVMQQSTRMDDHKPPLTIGLFLFINDRLRTAAQIADIGVFSFFGEIIKGYFRHYVFLQFNANSVTSFLRRISFSIFIRCHKSGLL